MFPKFSDSAFQNIGRIRNLEAKLKMMEARELQILSSFVHQLKLISVNPSIYTFMYFGTDGLRKYADTKEEAISSLEKMIFKD